VGDGCFGRRSNLAVLKLIGSVGGGSTASSSKNGPSASDAVSIDTNYFVETVDKFPGMYWKVNPRLGLSTPAKASCLGHSIANTTEYLRKHGCFQSFDDLLDADSTSAAFMSLDALASDDEPTRWLPCDDYSASQYVGALNDTVQHSTRRAVGNYSLFEGGKDSLSNLVAVALYHNDSKTAKLLRLARLDCGTVAFLGSAPALWRDIGALLDVQAYMLVRCHSHCESYDHGHVSGHSDASNDSEADRHKFHWMDVKRTAFYTGNSERILLKRTVHDL
jgi:hypothetical protein